MTDPDGTDIYEDCPFCDTEKLPSRIGTHLYEEHWQVIGELASEKTRADSEDVEERDFAAGFGRWEDRDTDHLYRECPICGSDVYRGKVGGHLDKHWDEIVELVQKSE